MGGEISDGDKKYSAKIDCNLVILRSFKQSCLISAASFIKFCCIQTGTIDFIQTRLLLLSFSLNITITIDCSCRYECIHVSI